MSDFDFIAASRKAKTEKNDQAELDTSPKKSKRKRELQQPVEQMQLSTAPNPVGRPRNGKRSDPDWIGRTFYVKSETDLTLGIAIATLKAQGVQFDKSDLVEMLLSEWLEMHPDEKLDWCRSKFAT